MAARLEALDHAARRGDRDLVLARPPTEDDGDAPPSAHCVGPPGVVDVVVVVGGTVSVPSDVRTPTVTVTGLPGASGSPPVGSCPRTTPSCEGSVTSCFAIVT